MVLRSTVHPLILLITMAILCRTVNSIDCYQCVSTDHGNSYLCPEFMPDEGDPDGFNIVSKDCSHIHGAKYCIKSTGRFEGWCIRCYQCEASKDVGCSDALVHDVFSPLPTSCDHVFEARYCIKTSGLNGGGIGTKRFCSAHDFGNYCNYVQQPGDELEYRSCVYTCSSDGCNHAHTVAPSSSSLMLLLVVSLMTALHR